MLSIQSYYHPVAAFPQTSQNLSWAHSHQPLAAPSWIIQFIELSGKDNPCHDLLLLRVQGYTKTLFLKSHDQCNNFKNLTLCLNPKLRVPYHETLIQCFHLVKLGIAIKKTHIPYHELPIIRYLAQLRFHQSLWISCHAINTFKLLMHWSNNINE